MFQGIMEQQERGRGWHHGPFLMEGGRARACERDMNGFHLNNETPRLCRGPQTTRRIHRKGSFRKQTATRLALKVRTALIRLMIVQKPERIFQEIQAVISSFIISPPLDYRLRTVLIFLVDYTRRVGGREGKASRWKGE
jgi:hypothetical protein